MFHFYGALEVMLIRCYQPPSSSHQQPVASPEASLHSLSKWLHQISGIHTFSSDGFSNMIKLCKRLTFGNHHRLILLTKTLYAEHWDQSPAGQPQFHELSGRGQQSVSVVVSGFQSRSQEMKHNCLIVFKVLSISLLPMIGIAGSICCSKFKPFAP